MAEIRFEDVTKRYPGAATPSVDSVSFTVAEGVICMLVGTSGSGKTTLLRMVNRLIDPTEGRILIGGRPTTEQDPITLRRGIGYVIQQVGLFPHMTIAENVRVVPSILGQSGTSVERRVDELLDLVGLEPREYRGRYPRQLSGGQQQRVGLARALAADPDVLLMDEPFGALDAITRGRMQEELLRVQRGVKKTILFVSHDVEEAFKLGDQIAVLSEGRLIQLGTPVELLLRPANDFVRQLVGADNVVRRFQYTPVTFALEPIITAEPEPGALDIAANETLLPALLRLIESGAPALLVKDGDLTRGRVTLAGIDRALRDAGRDAARQPGRDAGLARPGAAAV